MSVVIVIAAAMLGVAALLVLVRLTTGPTILDRGVALDVLMAVSICGISLHAAYHHTTYTLPVLLVLSLVGFVGAVSLARYASRTDDVEAEDDEPGDGGGA